MEPLLAERETSEEEVRELLGARREARRPDPQRRHARRRRADRAGQAHRFLPALHADRGADAIVSQFDKDDVEEVGLVKFDFLGLTHADHPRLDACATCAARSGADVDLETLPLDDKATYDVFRTANTTAVFQFESRGMRDTAEAGAADRFEDIIALIALYRPGPMELIPDFIARKHGRERVEYPRSAPGADPGDHLRRHGLPGAGDADRAGDRRLHAGRRRPAAPRDGQEEARGDGQAARHLRRRRRRRTASPRAKATQLFDLMEKFAGYGFNKSHAAAYALVAYQTAWLKAHHPAAFMAANLSLGDGRHRQGAASSTTTRWRSGLAILPPDVNASNYRFEPVDAKQHPLRPRRHQGHRRVARSRRSSPRARRAGRSATCSTSAAASTSALVNRRVVEALIRAGAFDAIDAAPRDAVRLGRHRARRGRARRGVGGAGVAVRRGGRRTRPRRWSPTREWTDAERLQHEKAALGLLPVRASLREPTPPSSRRSSGSRSPALQPRSEPVLIAGIVTALRVQAEQARQDGVRHARRRRAARPRSSSTTRSSTSARSLLREDQLVDRRGEGDAAHERRRRRSRACASSPSRSSTSATIRKRHAQRLALACNGGADAERLFELLCAVPRRRVPGRHRLPQPRPRAATIVAARRVARRPDDALIAQLREWLAPENVRVLY